MSSSRPSFHLTTPSPDFTAVARHLCVLPGSPGRTEYSPAQLVAFVPAAYSATTTTNHKRSSSTTQPSLAPHSIHLLHQLHLLQLLHQLLSHTTGGIGSCFSTTKPATLLDYPPSPLSSHSSLTLAQEVVFNTEQALPDGFPPPPTTVHLLFTSADSPSFI